MKNKFYSVAVGLLILVLFIFSYFVKKDSIEFQFVVYGFLFMITVLSLLVIMIVEKIVGKKFNKLDLFLISLFLSFIEEGISLMLSVFFVIGVIASFSLAWSHWPIINLIAYLVITLFNHSVYKHKQLVGLFAIVGTIFLFVSMFFIGSKNYYFLLLAFVGLLYSPVMFRVFNLEIPSEMNR